MVIRYSASTYGFRFSVRFATLILEVKGPGEKRLKQFTFYSITNEIGK